MKILKITAILIAFLGIVPLPATGQEAQIEQKQTAIEETVEVYYFHYTRRCAGCKAVEAETQKALQFFFPEAMKTGKIAFRSVNLDEKENEALADKIGVSAQSLLVVKGNAKEDLTDMAFMYARTKPEKYHKTLRKTIENL